MDTMHVGSGTTRGPLTLFPVWTTAPERHRDYYDAVQAEHRHLLSIGESTTGPTVRRLQVRNSGHQPVLLLQGEVLAGGWQTRVLTASVLVPAKTAIDVPVACVEQGRWGGATGHARAHTSLPLSLRAMLAGASPQAQASQQDSRWQNLASRQSRIGVKSATHSYLDDHAAVRLAIAKVVGGFRPAPGQRGVVVGLGGRVRALELFDQPKTLAANWKPLVEGYAAEALDPRTLRTAGPVRGGEARSFAERVEHTHRVSVPGIGEGVQVTSSGAVVTAGVRWQKRLVHLATFAA